MTIAGRNLKLELNNMLKNQLNFGVNVVKKNLTHKLGFQILIINILTIVVIAERSALFADAGMGEEAIHVPNFALIDIKSSVGNGSCMMLHIPRKS
jgi:hypothetical protein